MKNFQFLRFLYTTLLTFCLPFLFLRLLFRSRKNPQYRYRMLERLGIFKAPVQKNGFWIHAVSVGESVAAAQVVRALMHHFPEIPITITTGTPTGSTQIQKLLGNSVFHVYFPFDLPWCMNAFLHRIQPRLCLFMETELWPNCLNILKKNQIPAMILNGRISPRSLAGYSRVRSSTKEMLSSLTFVAAQSHLDGERFMTLGLPQDRLRITGNIKFDLAEPDKAIIDEAAKLKEQWGAERLVWIAASTHAGEEELVLETFQKLRTQHPTALLILVPRHPERRDSVIQLLRQHSLSFVLRSTSAHSNSSDSIQKNTAVLLVDTLGEMPVFYQASDVAFVGGSFVPVGGHNTLEPAIAAKPIVVGPYIHNFLDITELLLQAQALKQVPSSEALLNILLDWFNSSHKRQESGMLARQVVLGNRGAINKNIELVASIIDL